MPVAANLLEIIMCPRTKQNLQNLSPEKVGEINKEIEAGGVKYYDESPVDQKLDEALISEDQKVIYRVDEGIPVMMIDKGIPTEQLNSI
jgi:uncharacterized protein YbaR (Trm112 family)